jgi:hypothetical protein
VDAPAALFAGFGSRGVSHPLARRDDIQVPDIAAERLILWANRILVAGGGVVFGWLASWIVRSG